MSDQREQRSGLARLVPGRMRGGAGIVVVAIVAFLLGAVLFGGGDENGTPRTGHEGHSASEQTSEPQVWTCSMHPQIKLPEPGKCPICYMDLIPLETGSGDDLGPRQLRLSNAARELAKIQTTPAVRAFAESEVRMVGRVAYDETEVAYITAWVPGRLDRLFADYTGITVQKGDHLVDMYSPQLVAAQEELIQARAAVDALQNTQSSVLRSTAVATLEAVRDKLRLWGLTRQQIEHIETTRETSDHLTIYAPIGGVVVHKDAREGMYVETGERIYTIADLEKLWVVFEAYESDLQWLRFGQHVEFTAQSIPGERFEAVISFIDPLVDPKTRTVKVRAVVENRDRKLKPDMFVRGVVKSRIDSEGHIIDEYLADKWISPMHPEIVKSGPGQCDVCGMDLVPAESLGFVGSKQEAADAPLLIPASAPLITGKRAVVYVELPGGDGPLFEGREVELGPRAGDYYVVRSGIEEGELIVSNGAFKIDSELQLQAKPSMMSPAGAQTTHGDRGDEAKETGKPDRLEESDEAVGALAPVYTSYFDVQMALAKDDLAAARKSGAALATAAKDVDMSVFSRAGHDQWMALRAELVEHADRMEKAADIETARDAFFDLSEATIALQRTFGHPGVGNHYLAHCPMARDGDGAYWLQTVDTVWNSFYGASMLRCGSIDETFASNNGEAE